VNLQQEHRSFAVIQAQFLPHPTPSTALKCDVFGTIVDLNFQAEAHFKGETKTSFCLACLDPMLAQWDDWLRNAAVTGEGGRSLITLDERPVICLFPSDKTGPKLEHNPRERFRRLFLSVLVFSKETKSDHISIVIDLRKHLNFNKVASDLCFVLLQHFYNYEFLNSQFQAGTLDLTASKNGSLQKSIAPKSLSIRMLVSEQNQLDAQWLENALQELKLQITSAFAIQFARFLGDLPANALWPLKLAETLGSRFKELGASVAVWDHVTLENKGFGGIVAVGKGSAQKPALLVAEYAPDKYTKTIVLVGKGVTFDTGGYSIKGKQHHNEMKFDMCGAANIGAAFEMLLGRNTKARVVCLIACAENMIGVEAQRPGDVYTAFNGKTVDVFNTDAEGRLLLADALAFSETFSPDLIIDMATLTGGAASISGKLAAVGCANDSEIWNKFYNFAVDEGERFTRLELIPGAIDDMKGSVSDYANMNAKWSTQCPTLYAAAFLQEFVPVGVNWLHLDIANVAWGFANGGPLSGLGANGYGARSVADLVVSLTRE
jgi:leucyl aminopeptidase